MNSHLILMLNFTIKNYFIFLLKKIYNIIMDNKNIFYIPERNERMCPDDYDSRSTQMQFFKDSLENSVSLMNGMSLNVRSLQFFILYYLTFLYPHLGLFEWNCNTSC
jgi:hypothetical protein